MIKALFGNVSRHQLSLHGIIFLWGFTGILGKLISIDSISIVWWRMTIAFIGLVAFMFATRRPLRGSISNIAKYVLIGIITAVHWIFFFEAIKVSNVSITLTTLASTSLFVALIEPVFFRRKIIAYEVVFGLIIIFGLGLIFQAETEYGRGILFALISAILAAVFSTINGIFVRYDNPTKITAYEMLGGVIGISVYTLFNTDQVNIPVFIDWFWLLLLGLVCTSMAFVVSIEVMKTLSPFTVSISINMEPIYAIIFALLLFKEDEYMSPLFYAGATIVIGTIFLNSYFKRKAQRTSAQQTN